MAAIRPTCTSRCHTGPRLCCCAFTSTRWAMRRRYSAARSGVTAQAVGDPATGVGLGCSLSVDGMASVEEGNEAVGAPRVVAVGAAEVLAEHALLEPDAVQRDWQVRERGDEQRRPAAERQGGA